MNIYIVYTMKIERLSKISKQPNFFLSCLFQQLMLIIIQISDRVACKMTSDKNIC